MRRSRSPAQWSSLVGELEVHVFRTLAQEWRPHDLWDVIFHVLGEAIALMGWLLLPRGEPRG
ncbi:MAG: hypothetical protein WEB06_07165 [Actinomycetota bacterium]